jgi:hypothetical protein
MGDQSKNQDFISCDNYVVLWLDILGVGREYARNLPEPGEKISQEHINHSKSVTQRIIELRKVLREIMDGPIPYFTYPHDAQHKVSQQYFNNMVNSRKIRIQELSDTIVIYSPLSWTGRLPNTYAVAWLAAVASRIMVVSLLANLPLRGCMTISTGCEVNDTPELFGHVMVRAHHVESKVANWPRIVIDYRYKKLLDDAEHDRAMSADEYTQTVTRVALQASKLICMDTDKTHIIDWLGKVALEHLYKKPIDKRETFAGIRKTIANQLELAKDDKEIKVKYLKLLDYVNKRDRKWRRKTRS